MLAPESIKMQRGIHMTNKKNIHDLFMTMIFEYPSVISRSMSSVSPEMRNDLKSQL